MARLAAAIATAILGVAIGAAQAQDLGRGEYLFGAAGCAGCHTDVAAKGPALGGGRAFDTPFGRFYGPNISPDPTHGIGDWDDRDFIRALREGISPDGSNYFPVFPYAAFTGMTDRDILDIQAYLFSLPPVAVPSRPHEVDFPFGWRAMLTPWKWLNFRPGPLAPDPARTEDWNRGAYLVEAVAHCGECHTPRDATGGLERDRAMAGARAGPEGKPVPNITPDRETGIGDWSGVDIAFFLLTGITPEGDAAGGLMAEVIERSTRHLTAPDRAAIARYLGTLPPIRNRIARGKAAAAE